MRAINELVENYRLGIEQLGEDGGHGWIHLPHVKKPLAVVFSWGGGWDHVSISHRSRIPSWDEMCMVKEIFFDDEECVVQYHPPRSQYVNNHPNVLHLWKPQDVEMPMPPKIFV